MATKTVRLRLLRLGLVSLVRWTRVGRWVMRRVTLRVTHQVMDRGMQRRAGRVMCRRARAGVVVVADVVVVAAAAARVAGRAVRTRRVMLPAVRWPPERLMPMAVRARA